MWTTGESAANRLEKNESIVGIFQFNSIEHILPHRMYFVLHTEKLFPHKHTQISTQSSYFHAQTMRRIVFVQQNDIKRHALICHFAYCVVHVYLCSESLWTFSTSLSTKFGIFIFPKITRKSKNVLRYLAVCRNDCSH